MKKQDASKKTTQMIYKQDPDSILADVYGDRYREYRRKWDAADRLEYLPEFPLELGFDLKFGCNLKCIGCYFTGGDRPLDVTSQSRKDFPFEKYLDILREGQREDLYSVYFGYASEPTMNKNYLDYVEECRRHDVMDIWFGTNATAMDESEIDAMIEMGVSRFLVSVDANTKETYEKVRVGGDFDRVVHNVKYLAAKKKELKTQLPIIRMSYVVNSVNEHELEDFHATWRSIADYISVQHFYDIGEKETASLAVQERKNAVFTCQQPFQRMFIHPDGRSFPCCSFENVYSTEIAEEGVFERGVKAVWNSQRFQILRDKLKANRFGEYECCAKCAVTSWE